MQRDHEYHALTVAEVVDETADARSFVLEVPPDLADRFAYAAGQFCTFRATIDGETVARCYSMSSSPEAGDPLTDAELHPTIRDQVQGRQSLCRAGRVVIVRDDLTNTVSKTNIFGSRSGGGKKYLRCRRMRILVEKVMLDRPDGVNLRTAARQ